MKQKSKTRFDDTDIIIPVVLVDTAKMTKTKASTKRAIVRINDLGIEITVEGYGDAGTVDDYGSPIFIEFHDGKLMARLYADINQEDPTHNIEMEGALEINRSKETA